MYYLNKLNYNIKLLLLFLIFSLVGCGAVRAPSAPESVAKYRAWITFDKVIENRMSIIEASDEFSFDLFMEYMRLAAVPNRMVATSQSLLETMFFRSDIFNENNNLFGMKEPRVRMTTAVGTNRGHAIYEHWTCSVRDYKYWYEYMTRNRSYENYYHFLSSIGYAEDPQYIFKLKIIKEGLKNESFLTQLN
jgi:uncharacterized FlgJ-related protein